MLSVHDNGGTAQTLYGRAFAHWKFQAYSVKVSEQDSTGNCPYLLTFLGQWLVIIPLL
jgi:hypothetical protein